MEIWKDVRGEMKNHTEGSSPDSLLAKLPSVTEASTKLSGSLTHSGRTQPTISQMPALHIVKYKSKFSN